LSSPIYTFSDPKKKRTVLQHAPKTRQEDHCHPQASCQETSSGQASRTEEDAKDGHGASQGCHGPHASLQANPCFVQVDDARSFTNKIVSFHLMSAVPYKTVQITQQGFGDVVKDTSAKLFVVPIDPPVRIQTTPVVLTTSIEDPQVPFVYIQGDQNMMTFFKQTEQDIEDVCISNKKQWFTLAKDLDDEILRRGYKSFFSDQGYKVKVAPDVPCFDANKRPIGREDVPENSTARMVLEMNRISFGRHEFGVTWQVVQLQLVPVQCMIQDDDPPEDPVDTHDDIKSEIDADFM
jgi:hypothetical protein